MDEEEMEGFFDEEEVVEAPEGVVAAVDAESPPHVTEDERRVAYIRELFESAGCRKPCLLCAARSGYFGYTCPSFPKNGLKAHLNSLVHKDERDEAKYTCKICFNVFFREEDLADHIDMMNGYAH